MGLIRRGTDWLDRRMKSRDSQSATFRDGAIAIPLFVRLGNTEVQAEGANGVFHSWRSQDFLITAADLVHAGHQIEPCRGNKIETEFHGRLCIFEVLPISDGRTWHWSDAGRTTMRIHTKEVGQ